MKIFSPYLLYRSVIYLIAFVFPGCCVIVRYVSSRPPPLSLLLLESRELPQDIDQGNLGYDLI